MLHLYDAHQHFHFEALVPHHAAIDAGLRAVGLQRAVVNGTCEEEWPVVARLANEYAWILPSYGIHPWDCGNRSPDWLPTLRYQLAADPNAGVGEIGLDRWIIDGVKAGDPRIAGLRIAPMDEQCEVFAAQLALAAELNRAASIHCVQAFGILADVLRSVTLPARGFLLHGYAGPAGMVPLFRELGAYFSFNIETLKHAGRASPSTVAKAMADKPDEPPSAPGSSGTTRPTRLDVWKHIPTDRLLVETDAPAKAPPPERNRFPLGAGPDGSEVNHPANITVAYEALAELRGMSVEALAGQVAQNFTRLFL